MSTDARFTVNGQDAGEQAVHRMLATAVQDCPTCAQDLARQVGVATDALAGRRGCIQEWVCDACGQRWSLAINYAAVRRYRFLEDTLAVLAIGLLAVIPLAVWLHWSRWQTLVGVALGVLLGRTVSLVIDKWPTVKTLRRDG